MIACYCCLDRLTLRPYGENKGMAAVYDGVRYAPNVFAARDVDPFLAQCSGGP